jgi:hypothetical protein
MRGLIKVSKLKLTRDIFVDDFLIFSKRKEDGPFAE